MKMVLAVVAFATLLGSPGFCQAAGLGDPQTQKKQFRVDDRDPYFRQNGPAPKSDPTEQWPCSTAPQFCSDYHGENGS